MNKTICSGAIIRKNNKFLFGKRVKSKSWAPGCWDFVGGKAKNNETPVEACIRETLEETGICIKSAHLVRRMEVAESEGSFQYYIFLVTKYSGQVKNVSNEHTKLKWFTAKELTNKKLALPEYEEILMELSS